MRIVIGKPFISPFRGDHTAGSTVEAGPAAQAVVGDPAVIEGVDVQAADVVVGTVVIECPASPVAAVITMAPISKAIAHAAIEADMRPPVAGVKQIGPAVPAPIAWGP